MNKDSEMTDVNYRYSILYRDEEIQANNVYQFQRSIGRSGTSKRYYNPSRYQQQQQQQQQQNGITQNNADRRNTNNNKRQNQQYQQNPALVSGRQFQTNPVLSPHQPRQQHQRFGQQRNQFPNFGQQTFQRIPYPFNGQANTR